MAPILGIWASQITGKLNSYESISTVNVGSGGAANVTFSSIPATYQHLQIRFFGISAANYSEITFNSDFAGNYSYHQLTGDGSTGPTASGAGTLSQIYAPQLSSSTTYPAVGVIDILDYTNTNKNKTVRLLSGVDSNGGGFIYFRSGAWFNTSAISTIRIAAQGGTGTFAQNTSIALYGIRG
jgi:hypothetical protein